MTNELIYIIAVNVISFITYLINIHQIKRNKKTRLDIPLMIMALLLGAVGILLCCLIFDRKSTKDNMMIRVFSICILVVQIILLIVLKNDITNLNYNLLFFLINHKYLLIYLLIINILTFIIFAVDKYKAVKNRRRVRITVLLFLAFIGGTIGALCGIYFLRHKTKKNYFTLGVPMILLMHLIIILWIMNIDVLK